MNRFQHHHRDSILFGYSCFDRVIFKGCILPFMHTERSATIRRFLRTHRQIEQTSRAAFARISREYHEVRVHCSGRDAVSAPGVSRCSRSRPVAIATARRTDSVLLSSIGRSLEVPSSG